MTRNPTAPRMPSILVVSCSDSRLTAEDAAQSWRSRLGFDGDIFEVRCPGGGIALADKDSAFYKSTRESFELLSQGRQFSHVILAFHEDCAYFRSKYGTSTSTSMADAEQRKYQLIDEASRNVSGWASDLAIRPVYMIFEDGEACWHDHPSPAAEPPPRQKGPRRDEVRWRLPEQLDEDMAKPWPMRTTAPAPRILTATTLRGFNRVVEEELITGGGSLDDAIGKAESQAGNFAGTPPWRIERHAREFLALLLESGRKDMQEIRQLLRSFVRGYAGEQAPAWVVRGIMNELNDAIEPGALAPAPSAQRT